MRSRPRLQPQPKQLHHERRHPQRLTRGGYTLIELIVAVVASSFLIMGLGSSIFIATKIVDPGRRTQQILDGSDAVRQINDELRYANYIIDRSETAIEFVIHDRTGDGQADRIRYEWTGTAGAPLTKTINDSDSATIVASVEYLNFDYIVDSTTEQFETPPIESAEMVLTEYLGATFLSTFRITENNWIGQYTEPALFNVNSLPSDTISWTVTKAEVRARYTDSGGNGEAWVRIRPATGDNKPATTVVDEAVLSESSLSGSYANHTLTFSNQVALAPTDSICLTVEHKANGDAADIEYDEINDNWRVVTTTGGATWYHPPYQDSLRHRIYGKYIQPSNTVETVTRQYLKAVAITLQVGEPDTTVVTEGNVLNQPELCSTFWETGFDTDPTVEDYDVNGTGDWRMRDGSGFVTASLANGIFDAYGVELDTASDRNFDKTTTMNVRMRNITVGGEGAMFGVNADWSGSTAAPIYAALQLQTDDTQTLRVFRKDSAAVTTEVATVEGLSTDFVDIRLVIEPASDVFAVWVKDQFVGSFRYTPFNTGNDHRWATIHESGSEAQFDYVSIKVAE